MLDQPTAQLPIRIDEVDDPALRSMDVALRVARLDLIDADINGNKWYKLCRNLQQAQALGIKRLVSFGGAWSNHLHALAAAGARFGFETIGIVRGEPAYGLTPTLLDAQGFGMQLHFVDRREYRWRDDADYLQQLAQRFAPCLIIPEGGSNDAGIAGCEMLGQQLLTHVDAGFDGNAGADINHVVCAAATGATITGLARGLDSSVSLHAVCVLHAADSVRQMLERQAQKAQCRVDVVTGYEFGGYARVSPKLFQFMADVKARSGIALEPIYTGKALFALYDLILKGKFKPGSRILFIHTGGMQGRRGWNGSANGQLDFAWHNDNHHAITGTAS